VDEFKKRRDGCGVQEEKRKRASLAFEDVMFILMVGALEKVMGNRLRGDTSAVWAYWRFRAADMEEMLVEWRIACIKLC